MVGDYFLHEFQESIKEMSFPPDAWNAVKTVLFPRYFMPKHENKGIHKFQLNTITSIISCFSKNDFLDFWGRVTQFPSISGEETSTPTQGFSPGREMDGNHSIYSQLQIINFN